MIHRHLIKIQAFDAMFLTALSIAAYIHVGYLWLIYVIAVMVSVSIFRIFKDMSSWFQNIGDQINFNARCIRDHN